MYRIAIIEDHPDSRDFLIFSLSFENDFNLTGFESAKDAAACIQAGNHFDLLVSDIRMPEMTGLDLIHYVRDELHLSQLPAIAISAHAYDYDRLTALNAGFNDYLRKPLEISELISHIRALLPAQPDAPGA